MHYYVQIECKNAFHFMYKEWYIPHKKSNIFSIFIIKLFSNPICEQNLYFGKMAIIINHLEQPEHGRVWNVDCLFSPPFLFWVGLCYSFQTRYRLL